MNRIRAGACVIVPGGRIGRVRATVAGGYRVRVRRRTGTTHQFLRLNADRLKPVECPQGWMSPDGYNRYLRVTLAKMRRRRSMKRTKA